MNILLVVVPVVRLPSLLLFGASVGANVFVCCCFCDLEVAPCRSVCCRFKWEFLLRIHHANGPPAAACVIVEILPLRPLP
jgi:hypothetical protein